MFYAADDALAYEASRWDRVRWAMRSDASSALRESENVLADALRTVADEGSASVDRDAAYDLSRTFAGEVFARLTEDPDAVENAAWAGKAQSLIDEVDEFGKLRAALGHDPDLAAIATKGLLDAVSGQLPKLLAAEPESDEDGQDGEPGEGEGQGAGDGQGSGEAKRERAAFRAAVRRAVAQATEDVTNAREALDGLAPGMGSTPATHDQEDTSRLSLAEMLLSNPRFAEVLRRAGKLRRLAASTARRRASGVGTVVGLERGADLGRVLPAQLARLKHPRLRALVKKDLAERALLQYRVEGSEPQGRGPIVLLVDESGSMDGEPATWAKAAVIAAIRQGQAENRPVHVAYFDTRIRSAFSMTGAGDVSTVTTYAPVENVAPFGKVGDLVSDALRRSTGGGTDFSAPFAWALDLLDAGDDRADLIIVTDGLASASDDVRERLTAHREAGLRVYALTLGYGDASTLSDLCDEVVPLDRIPEDEIADRLAATVPTSP